MADSEKVDITELGNTLHEKRAALARMVKEHNRLCVTNENSALAQQVHGVMVQTQADIAELYDAAKPPIDRLLDKKNKSLRKLQRALEGSDPDDRDDIKRRIKIKKKLIKKLTVVLNGPTQIQDDEKGTVDLQQENYLVTSSLNNCKTPSPQKVGMEAPESNRKSPSSQCSNVYGAEPTCTTMDAVLIECHLNDSLCWVAPICVPFTSCEGIGRMNMNHLVFIFINTIFDVHRYKHCSVEMPENQCDYWMRGWDD